MRVRGIARGIALGAALALLAAREARASTCEIRRDGVRTDLLDCAQGGAWTVWCVLPEEGGKVALHASMPARGLSGTARLPLSARGAIEIPLSGPGGASGRFLVDKPQQGLLAGQALGPHQWCPVVQPDVAPGAPRASLRLEVVLSTHPSSGFAERQENGVTVREPVYGEGVPRARAAAQVLQRPVGSIPVLTGPVEPEGMPLEDEAIRGRLQLLVPQEGGEGIWRSVGFSGRRQTLPLESGPVTLAVVDFVAPEVASAAGGDPEALLEKDLSAWLASDPSSLLGLAAWSRSGFDPRLLGARGKDLAFAPAPSGGWPWREARTDRLSVRVGTRGDRLRVVIAWRAAPWDAGVRAAVDEAAGR